MDRNEGVAAAVCVAIVILVIFVVAVASSRWSDKSWRDQCVDRGVAHWEVDDRGESIFVWDYELKGPDDE